MSEEKHTPGPWAWFGNASSNSIYLATTHSGRRYVMDFVRWGMRGAQPRFQPEKGGMIDAKDLVQFAVGDKAIVGVDAARNDPSVYRYDIRGINSADAHLIAAAPDLLAEVEQCAIELEEASEVFDGRGFSALAAGFLASAKRARAAIARAEGRSG